MTNSTFTCIDAHTCGNPVRVVTDGGPVLEGATMLEKRAHFQAEFDWIRTGLMFEPRGHEVMSGSILYEPTRPDCDLGILFIEVSGCLPMCGHGTTGQREPGPDEWVCRPPNGCTYFNKTSSFYCDMCNLSRPDLASTRF